MFITLFAGSHLKDNMQWLLWLSEGNAKFINLTAR